MNYLNIYLFIFRSKVDRAAECAGIAHEHNVLAICLLVDLRRAAELLVLYFCVLLFVENSLECRSAFALKR